MIYVSRTRKTYNGFREWTTASILYCFALAFMSFRNILPDFISIIAANTIIVAGNGCIAYGLELFSNSRKRRWLFVLLTISVTILFVNFTYFSPDVSARIVVISTAVAILCGYSGYIVYKHIPRLINGQNRFLVIVFGIQTLWLILRVVQTIFMESPIVDFIHAPAFHGITVIVFFSGNIFLVIGLIVLNFQRVEFDLSAAMAEIKTLRGIVPICSYCKNIRDDKGFWNKVDAYVMKHTEAEFSHGICPQCIAKHYPEYEEEINR